MKLLITGVAGFIGAKVAEAALDNGYVVVGVDDLSQGYAGNVPSGCEFIKGNLIDPNFVNSLPKDCEVILHLAGQSSGEISFDNPISDLEKNTISTLNLIKYGISNRIKKMVYASSMSVYGATEDRPIDESYVCAPLSCYGVGKLAAENYLRIYQEQIPHTIFRMFNVYGPGQDMNNLRQGMVSIYLAHILKNGHIPVKGGVTRFRDFIYIDDVVNIWLKSIENNDLNNQCFNLGTGVKTTVLELLQKIQGILPDFTWEEVQNTLGDQFGIYADTKKIKNLLVNYSFTSLDAGLLKFIEWLKKNQNL